jgi:hypothetical protein
VAAFEIVSLDPATPQLRAPGGTDTYIAPKDVAVTGTTTTEGYVLASAGIITDATASRTLAAGDNGRVIYFTSNSAVTVDTDTGLGAGFSCVLVQGGTGQITVTAAGGTTVVSYGAFIKTAGQYASVSVLCPVADTFYLNGDLA